MPPRRAKLKAKGRRDAPWTPTVALALTIGAPSSAAALSDNALRAAWQAHREALLETTVDVASGLPGFWLYEPDLPHNLRHEPPLLYPVEDHDRVTSERERLYDRRRAWLREQRPDLVPATLW